MKDEWKSKGEESRGQKPREGINRCGRHKGKKSRVAGAYCRGDLEDRDDL